MAAALLRIKTEKGEWLIPEPMRTQGTQDEIIRAVQFDHGHRHAEDGPDTPQNLYPMRPSDHGEKSRRDTSEIAKGKAAARLERQHQRSMAVKLGADPLDVAETRTEAEVKWERRKARSRMRGGREDKWKRTIGGKVVPRTRRR